MNLNSQYAFFPPQPDNPTDEDRRVLLKYALSELGWPQDMQTILRLMAPPKPVTEAAPPGSLRGIRVGILGGGLAGLSAAYELRKMGCDITVFDALTDRVGGRVYTYFFEDSPNAYGEFGPMRIPVAHETVWHYIKLFGLSTYPFIQANPNGFAYLKSTRVRNDADGVNVQTSIYPKYELSQWERKTSWQKLLSIGTDDQLRSATTAERAEIIEVKPQYSRRTLEWINRSSMNLMEAAGLSQGAINLVSNFSPLLAGNLYNSFIDYIQEDYPAAVSYLYAFTGGTMILPISFYQSFFSQNPYPDLLPASIGTVKYKAGHLVKGIYMHDSGKHTTIRYEITPTHEQAAETFDYIVCAIPFSTLRNIEIDPIFSGIKMRAVREVNYTPAQKSILYFSERFWEKQGIVGGPSLTDLPIASLWYASDHARQISNPDDIAGDIRRLKTNEPGVLIGSYDFGLDTTRLLNQPPEIAFEEIKREIATVHGLPTEYINQIVKGYKAVNWNQEPTFRGALSFFTPEQKRIFAYGMTLPEYGGRVFFAGEHISANHRWMQGALETGMQAAHDLVKAAI